MTTTYRIDLPRACSVHLGNLSDERAAEIAERFQEAEQQRRGLILEEHRRMTVVEIGGIHTGRVTAELHAVVVDDVPRYLRSPPAGGGEVTVLLALPPQAITRAELVPVAAAAG